MTFRVGDRIAHPMHGAGVIESIVTKRINGMDREYYVLKLPTGGMQVMVPVETSDVIGVRPIVDPKQAEAILGAIPGIHVEMTSNWNKRYRENMLRIKSGDLMEVACVVKMLHSAKQILISEIVLSESSSYEEVEARLDSAMCS